MTESRDEKESRQIPTVTAFFIINSDVDPLRPSLFDMGNGQTVDHGVTEQVGW